MQEKESQELEMGRRLREGGYILNGKGDVSKHIFMTSSRNVNLTCMKHGNIKFQNSSELKGEKQLHDVFC